MLGRAGGALGYGRLHLSGAEHTATEGHTATARVRARYLARSNITVTLLLHVLDLLWHKGRPRIKSVSGRGAAIRATAPKLDFSETMWPTVFLVLGNALLDWAAAREIDP